MSKPARHLYVVQDRIADENGEIVSPERLLADLQAAETQIRMLERERAGQRLRIAQLQRDKAKERDEHPRRADVERCHAYWQRRCNHPRAGLDDATFFAIAALLELRVENGKRREREFSWPDDFKRAIDGAAFDPWVTTRKNGSKKRHDDLGLIFRDAAHMREFVAKAPGARPAGEA